MFVSDNEWISDINGKFILCSFVKRQVYLILTALILCTLNLAEQFIRPTNGQSNNQVHYTTPIQYIFTNHIELDNIIQYSGRCIDWWLSLDDRTTYENMIYVKHFYSTWSQSICVYIDVAYNKVYTDADTEWYENEILGKRKREEER